MRTPRTSFPVALAALLLLALLAGPVPVNAEPASVVVAVVVVKGDLSFAIMADPAARLDAVALVVRDGRISGYLAEDDPIPDGAEVIDGGDAYILPGLVDACGLTRDARVNAPDPITPDHLALDGFDPFANNDELLAEGITTMWLSPSRGRLLSGIGAVVRTAGEDRVTDPRSTLRLTLGSEGLNPPAVHRPPLEPVPFDDPLTPALPPPPTTRAAAVAMLRSAFADAESGPLAEAREGKLCVRIHVSKIDEIRQAVRLVQNLKLPAVLELGDAAEARKARKILREAGLPYVLEQGGADAADVLRDVGPGALTRPGAGGLLDLAVSVARNAGDLGALRAVTIDAARVLGIESTVGSLDVGKDADLVLVDGNPLSSRASVRCVLARGQVVHRRTTTPGLVAVRAARVLTGDEILTDVVLVCRDGKILEIGRDVHVPADAERLEFEGTVVPGFIDGWSNLGLSSGDLSVPAAEVAKADDEALGRLRARGVTSLVLVPRGTGLTSGMASVVSTALEDGAYEVLRRDAALTVNVATRGDRAAQALKLRDLMATVVRYIATFEVYEKQKAAAEKAGEKFTKKPPRPNRTLELWRRIAEQELALLVRADLQEDIRMALTVLHDGFPDTYPHFAILGGAQTFLVLEDVVKAKVPVVLPGWSRPFEPDVGRIHLGRRLARAGVPVVVGSAGGSFAPVVRLTEAIRGGISLRAALAAVTTNPARTFGVANVAGRIRPGYRADLVHLSADPGAPGCHVRHVLVGGRVVHEREELE